MSAEFVDTNILVYAYDPTTVRKHQIAKELMIDLWSRGAGRLSVQVLQELYWTVTRKVPKRLSASEAIELLEDLSAWQTFAPNADDVLAAVALEQKHQLSFWDAMIVLAALRSECSVLWSEDLSHERKIDSLTVRNPFMLDS